ALTAAAPALSAPFEGLSEADAARAGSNFRQYCSLCHGEERQGHVNDHAPSLRSKSLLEGGFFERAMAIGYGRLGTPMAGFLDEVGGPMSLLEIYQLNAWLEEQAGQDSYDFPMDPVNGDAELGQEIYARECTTCHGANGEGGIGTALGNPVMLSLTSDRFLRHAIVNGRDGTPMRAFRERLDDKEIDAVTAFLRSRATGWSVEKPVLRSPPEQENWILNPGAEPARFDLRGGMYVLSSDLNEAIGQGRRMVILDTRAMSMWQMANIEGSVPIPYYYDQFEDLSGKLPRDGTMIVTYCECPRAAAESVTRRLRGRGFANTAVLWEGIQGWVALGYPVARGESAPVDLEAVR
ncbi:MAG: c-type cytochrome, partial [Xanthomonadales bacterium]|nr:c-type cytochrome [Xanthomonadales bacterium]NIX13007.1 c-type cytochrome [Xanthomonadales bacterium]